jgi:lysozyme
MNDRLAVETRRDKSVAFFQRRNPPQSQTSSPLEGESPQAFSRHDFITTATVGLGAWAVAYAFRNRESSLKQDSSAPQKRLSGSDPTSVESENRLHMPSPSEVEARQSLSQPMGAPTMPSQAAIDLIKSFEGYRSRAYLCPAGQPTIGYGHTKGVQLGDTLGGESDAIRLLQSDLQSHAERVSRVFRDIPLTQSQFDALTSAEFNASCLKNGTTGFAQYARSVLPELNTTRDPDRRLELQKELVSYLCRYNRANGELRDGLLRRRLSEGLLLAGTRDPIVSNAEYKKLKQDACDCLKNVDHHPHRLIREMVSRSFVSRGLSRR